MRTTGYQQLRPLKALIIGASGQDGNYLTRHLLQLGLSVIGVSRRPVLQNFHMASPSFSWHFWDLERAPTVLPILEEHEPDLVFNLAGFSHVGDSWENRELSRLLNFELVKNLVSDLEQYREITSLEPFLFHISSSEIFGGSTASPQNENAPIRPITPYGEHKAQAHVFLSESRRKLGLDIGIAIAYNHESPIRPDRFVSRKISRGVSLVKYGLLRDLALGSLDSRRDWGFAGDYVRAMAEIALRRLSEDFIIATGVSHSIQEFVSLAFGEVGIDNWRDHVRVEEGLTRLNDPPALVGDSAKAEKILSWSRNMSFPALVKMMVEADQEQVRNSL